MSARSSRFKKLVGKSQRRKEAAMSRNSEGDDSEESRSYRGRTSFLTENQQHRKSKRRQYSATCKKCKVKFSLPFKPKNPEVFCPKCFRNVDKKTVRRTGDHNANNRYKSPKNKRFSRS